MVRITPKRFLVVIGTVTTVLLYVTFLQIRETQTLHDRHEFNEIRERFNLEMAEKGSDVEIKVKETGNDDGVDVKVVDKDNGEDSVIIGEKWIHKSHTENKTLEEKLAEIKQEKKRPNVCPLWPMELIGPMVVSPTMNETDIDPERLKLIGKGGKYRPDNCDPRERTAVIIPYRDRPKQLKILLSHLHNMLQKQKIEYGIYVIEMAYPTQFNKGILSNVGFMTATSIRDYTCYVIHDVDYIMVDDRNMYRCGRWPRHLVAYSSKYNYSLPYLSYFGGVVAFTPDQYWKINGYSNLYFGWGGEDDDAVTRIFAIGSHFSRPKKNIGGYVTIEHSHDSSNPPNPHRLVLLQSAESRREEDGVKSIRYTRLALEFRPLYTWVYINVNEAKIIQIIIDSVLWHMIGNVFSRRFQ